MSALGCAPTLTACLSYSQADMLTGKANPVLSGLPRLLMSLFTRRPFPPPGRETGTGGHD
jgi:hypothetical protein